MELDLSPAEHQLVDHAKDAVVRYNTKRHANGGIDTLYAFLRSNSGSIYDGAALEPVIAHATVCGERHAIANLVMNEAYESEIESIVVADSVPTVQEKGTFPCGTCRQLIWQFGTPDTSILLLQYIQEKNGWTFPKLEKFFISEIFPHPYEPIEGLWD